MGLMKKLFWDASPAVIIAKKAKDSQKNKQAEQSGISREQRDVKEAQEKADKQARKDRKKLSIGGAYYSSHPAIHGYPYLNLEFGQDGVYIVAKKDTVRIFGWNEVIGFDKKIEDKSQVSSNQRVTATRMAAVGVFALAAPKKTKSGNVRNDFFYSLHTTTGDIEIEQIINGGGGSGSFGDLSRNTAQLSINMQTAKVNNIKRFVAERATGKALQASQDQVSSVADELERYAQLKDKGVITQSEFESKKKELLSR
jgi:hypothetical protein